MRTTGAKALLDSLKRQGVQVIFGYPGGAVIPSCDAIYEEEEIRHILVRHEQGAAHMAEGYAKVTGKVGVCLATSGPGTTNLVTGIADAFMDSVPIVAITGQVRSHLIGTDAFQEVDIFGITLPIVKHSFLVRNVHDLPYVMREAFRIARSGRPGPVLVDMPRDIQEAKADLKLLPRIYDEERPPAPSQEALGKAAQLRRESRSALGHPGGGGGRA